MALILLRHTRPDCPEGLCYGRSDLGLAGDFLTEKLRIAAQLPDILRIVTSPLTRCRLLAEAVGEARGLPVTVEPGLAEMDFGAWEGRTWNAIPRAEIDAWRDDVLDARPHGGESVRDFSARVGAALDRAARGARPALVVAHAGVIKVARVARGDAAGWSSTIGFGEWWGVDWP